MASKPSFYEHASGQASLVPAALSWCAHTPPAQALAQAGAAAAVAEVSSIWTIWKHPLWSHLLIWSIFVEYMYFKVWWKWSSKVICQEAKYNMYWEMEGKRKTKSKYLCMQDSSNFWCCRGEKVVVFTVEIVINRGILQGEGFLYS